MIRRALKRGLGVARTAAKVAQGLITGPGGPGYDVGEFEDFDKMREEAAAQDLAEGIATYARIAALLAERAPHGA